MNAAVQRIQPLLFVSVAALSIFVSGNDLRFPTHGADPSQLSFAVALCAFALLILGLLLANDPLPRGRSARLAVAGLALWTLLTGLSIIWAPYRGTAASSFLLMLLYLGWLVAAIPTMRRPDSARVAETGLAATIAIAAAIAVTARLAPGLVHPSDSDIAFGRLSIPLGYWNSSGALFGVGLVLVARIGARDGRRRLTSIVLPAFAPLLGLALWLSYSRGALAATAAALLALIALRPLRSQAVSVALAAGTTLLVATVAELSLSDGMGVAQDSHGLATALVLLIAMTTTALLCWMDNRGDAKQPRTLGRVPIRVAIVATLVLLCLPLISVLAGQGSSTGGTGASASRLASLESNRTGYWSVALEQFAESPLTGGGAGSFAQEWLIHRGDRRPAQNAHSLELETLGELGLLGGISLLLFMGGTAFASRSALRRRGDLVAGPVAVLLLALSHSFVDWDWQLPGFVLPVLVMAAIPLASSEPNTGQGGRFMAHRLLVAALALLASAWFWHSWSRLELQRQAAEKIDVASILGWTPARFARIEQLLEDAAYLNPDPAPRIALINATIDSGRRSQALRLAVELTDRNPDYWLSWAMRARAEAAAGLGPAAARSRARARALRG